MLAYSQAEGMGWAWSIHIAVRQTLASTIVSHQTSCPHGSRALIVLSLHSRHTSVPALTASIRLVLYISSR
jgi:hypothetical protein